MNKNASSSFVMNEKSSEGTVCNEVSRFTGNSTSTYYNIINNINNFYFEWKKKDYTCMCIRQSQVNFASNPFVSWIFKSPDKQEHRGKIFY